MRVEEKVLRATPTAWRGGARVERQRMVAYLALLAAAAVGYVALRGAPGWGGPREHAVLEAIATTLALFLGVLALVRFYSKKNNVFLFLGTGFLAAAFLDGVHLVESAPFAAGAAAQRTAVEAWSWFASRTLLALFFCLNWLGWRRERRLGQEGRVGEGAVYITTALLTVATVIVIEAAPLSRGWTEAALPRPQELVPAGLFLFALCGYLWKAHWRDNAFDHWLVVSLLIAFVSEAPFMAFSSAPHDALFLAAHVLKVVSYLCVGVGLLVSVYLTFRRAEEGAAALAREVVQRERAQEELEVQKAYLERLFESAPEAIVVLDEEGRVARMNDEFTRTFGWPREEALGSAIEELIVPEDRRAEARTWQDRVARGQNVGYETIRRRKDGTTIDVSVLGTAIDLERGRTALYEIYRDITARKRAEEELRQAKEAAEEATRAKSEFLATMSHELRTPLNSVIGFANVLLKRAGDALDERGRGFLERIRENGLHLLDLINEILDLSKIEAGRMSVDLEEVDLEELVEETVDQFRGPVLDRDLELKAELPGPLEPIRTDRGKLKQILINLIGNAVKFTDRGRITVRVVAAGEARPVRIEVEDTGIGIPPDRLRKIFEAFEQAETGTARTYGGTGLGLAISSSLCRLLGYDLTVESEVGEGTCFSVVLAPRARGGPDLASKGDDHPAAGRALSTPG